MVTKKSLSKPPVTPKSCIVYLVVIYCLWSSEGNEGMMRVRTVTKIAPLRIYSCRLPLLGASSQHSLIHQHSRPCRVSVLLSRFQEVVRAADGSFLWASVALWLIRHDWLSFLLFDEKTYRPRQSNVSPGIRRIIEASSPYLSMKLHFHSKRLRDAINNSLAH